MAKSSTNKTQRYKLKVEFVLRDRKDYERVIADIREALKSLEDWGNLQIDYIAVETVKAKPSTS